MKIISKIALPVLGIAILYLLLSGTSSPYRLLSLRVSYWLLHHAMGAAKFSGRAIQHPRRTN